MVHNLCFLRESDLCFHMLSTWVWDSRTTNEMRQHSMPSCFRHAMTTSLLFLLLLGSVVPLPHGGAPHGISNSNSHPIFASFSRMRPCTDLNPGEVHGSSHTRKVLSKNWEHSEWTQNAGVAKSVQHDMPHAPILASIGCCFLFSWVLLCPCVQRRRKSDSKEFSSKETSTSISTSIAESSAVGSFSVSSSTCSVSLQKPLCQGGRSFTLSELSKATRKFSPTCKIGQGGFGAVYKGKLQDGTVVAIKRAKKMLYDTRFSSEFETEVEMLLSIDHLNLVKMIGYLEEQGERILVVEYVPNGNLREHLDGMHGVLLDLAMRLDICIDVAHALTYLHMYAGKPIIHRDVKPSNILLTEKFRAKVADFGYSRMGPLEVGQTHVSTQVKGTAGYLDPEYLKKFQLTEKSDVYAFGILLVEIITGRRPIDEKKAMKERVAIRWAFRKFLDGKVLEILDPKLEKTKASGMVVERIAELAFQCGAPTKLDRPCMKKVAEVLWDIRKDYQNLLQMERCTSLSGSESKSSFSQSVQNLSM